MASESIRYLDSLYADLEQLLRDGQPLGDILERFDKLVAQAELSSWIAGAVGVWQDSNEPRLYLLDALGPMQTKRFPWVEEAARWLMDRGVYSADEIQRQATPLDQPRWKSMQAVSKVRDELAFGFTYGQSFQDFYSRVKDKVEATKPELQNAFRTATHQAYIHGSTTTLEKPLVQLQFPNVLYHSAHDTRTRATHRPLDGLLFEIGSEAYVIAKKALSDFSCRCRITAMTPEKSKRHGKPVTLAELPAEVLAKYA